MVLTYGWVMAQELIKSGQGNDFHRLSVPVMISWIYLISMGLDSEESFKIMEAVRKGTVAKHKCANWDEWKADMKAHDVPDSVYLIPRKDSVHVPKAHAAAYVMMANSPL